MRAKGNVGSGAFTQDSGDEKCKAFYQGHRFAGSDQSAARTLFIVSLIRHANQKFETKLFFVSTMIRAV
jgi:hypothetical protein